MKKMYRVKISFVYWDENPEVSPRADMRVDDIVGDLNCGIEWGARIVWDKKKK